MTNVILTDHRPWHCSVDVSAQLILTYIPPKPAPAQTIPSPMQGLTGASSKALQS